MRAAAWSWASRNPAGTACHSTARTIARLFAPTAAADKLILQRHQEAQLRPSVSGEGASQGKHHRGGMAMTEATSHHYIPALGKVYDAVSEYAEPILRIALGAILIPHGMQKPFGAFAGMGLPATARCSTGSASRPAYSGARWSAARN